MVGPACIEVGYNVAGSLIFGTLCTSRTARGKIDAVLHCKFVIERRYLRTITAAITMLEVRECVKGRSKNSYRD